MNEEQKAFINELLKDSNINHGGKKSKGSKSKVSDDLSCMVVKTNFNYNGKPAVFKELFNDINPRYNNPKISTANILAEILKNKNYSYFEQWEKLTFSKNKTIIYGNKLYDVVMKLIEENEPNKYYDEK